MKIIARKTPDSHPASTLLPTWPRRAKNADEYERLALPPENSDLLTARPRATRPVPNHLLRVIDLAAVPGRAESSASNLGEDPMGAYSEMDIDVNELVCKALNRARSNALFAADLAPERSSTAVTLVELADRLEQLEAAAASSDLFAWLDTWNTTNRAAIAAIATEASK